MKWALFNWKAPKQVDTKNFVSKDFLNTTLRDYVLNNSLNTTLSNYVTKNTDQEIDGYKTFKKGITVQTTADVYAAILVKDRRNGNSHFSLSVNTPTNTALRCWTGDLWFQSQQNNKNIIVDRFSRFKLQNTILETGTEINAGYGGTTVKFIPEDNTTKTLQFYNANATDARRFNLLVPAPTAAQNPATKGYVDTNKADLQTQITSLNTNLGNRINAVDSSVTAANNNINNLIQKRDYQWTSMSSTPNAYGEQFVYSLQVTSLQETTVVGVNVSFQNQANSQTKSIYWNVSWNTTWGPKLYIKLFIDKYIYNSFSNKDDINLDWSKISIRVFYIPKYSSRESEKVYEGEVVNLPEIQGGK